MVRFRRRKDDTRSRRAVLLDRVRQAMVTFPNTPSGRALWVKRKNTSDLRGYDTSHQTRMSERWARVRHHKSLAELMDADLVDVEAEYDSGLSGSENTSEARKRMRDMIRF